MLIEYIIFIINFEPLIGSIPKDNEYYVVVCPNNNGIVHSRNTYWAAPTPLPSVTGWFSSFRTSSSTDKVANTSLGKQRFIVAMRKNLSL